MYFLITQSPTWASPNSIVLNTPSFLLRKFSSGNRNLIILPPQAGHHSCIADYAVDQSLVQVFIDKGYAVYAVEWLSCSWQRRRETIEDLIIQTKQCIDFVGTASLVGLCQAGWLAFLYTSRYPDTIESLVLAGSPLDFTAGGGPIQQIVQSTPQWVYESMVQSHGGLMPGYLILLGFKMMHPYERFIGDYIKYFAEWGDERRQRFVNWYESWQWLAGTWYLEAVENLFRRNRLFDYGNPSQIDCSVTLIAGQNDDITLPEQVFNMSKYLRDCQCMLIPNCGHIGLFMKKIDAN